MQTLGVSSAEAMWVVRVSSLIVSRLWLNKPAKSSSVIWPDKFWRGTSDCFMICSPRIYSCWVPLMIPFQPVFYKLSQLFLKIIALTILPHLYWPRVPRHKILASFITISATYPALPVQDNWKRLKASLRCNATVYPVHIVGDRLSCINGLRKLSKRSGIYDML